MIMRLNPKQPKLDKSKWHLWFAWYPVMVNYSWEAPDGQTGVNQRAIVWLSRIERKGFLLDGYGWEWKYRLV